MEELHPRIKQLQDNKQIIYHVYRGSYVYGTYIEGRSDKDIAGVYMSSVNDLIGFDYKNQISDDTNDTVFYDVKRFLELAQTSNPTVLEYMFTPEKFQIYKHPIMNKILDNKEKFVSKACKNSFSAYAIQQIKKAKGLDKKQNWEEKDMQRKTVFDFCYVPKDYESISAQEWLKERHLEQKYCGLVKLPHMKDVYAVFYNFNLHRIESKDKNLAKKWVKFEELRKPLYLATTELKYKGIVHDLEKSNDISLSEVPIGQSSICVMNFNKDGYSTHCRVYNEYENWKVVANRERLVDVKSHGQKIDGKNMLHCVRLIKTAKEIAEGQGIIVVRPDAEELLKIRRGEVDLQSIIEWGESQVDVINDLFDKSDLPETVDPVFVNDLLIEIRREFYGIDDSNFLKKTKNYLGNIFNKDFFNTFNRTH